MPLAVIMAMQAAVAGPPVPADLRPSRPATVSPRCGEPDAAGDIVVCARNPDGNRIGRLDPDAYKEKPIRATGKVGKGTLSAEAEQGSLPSGQSAPRAMLRLKLPF